MSFFSKIFSSDRALDSVDNIFNKVAGGIDNLGLTKQEQLEMKSDLMKSFEPFKLIQRYIALTILFLFSFIILLIVGCYVLSYWFDGVNMIAGKLFELIKEVLFVPFTIILSLYFTGGIPFLNAKKNK